jgi:lipopolysaccharide export system permease protein
VRILTRYVLFDLVKVFLLILTALTLLIFVALMGNEAVDKGLGLGPLLRMTPYLLPQALQFAVPGTMLLATTFVFGRMSAYNEVVAIKSLGISPMVLVWPALVLATLVSFAGVLLNDLAVSWGQAGIERVFLESIEEVAYGQLRVNKTFSYGPWTITVRRVDGHRLIQPMFVEQPTDGSRGQLALAAEAELHAIPAEGKLIARLLNAEVEAPLRIVYPDWFEMPISLTAFTGGSSRTRSPSNYALREIRPAILAERQNCDDIEQSMAAEASFAMLTGEFDSLSDESWKTQRRSLAKAEERLHRLHTEPWRRWANGFSCLCFVLIGAPMAIRLRHAEILAIFFVCFLPILIVYYPLMVVSVGQAKDGVVPPPAVWLGNVVLALWGFWLLRRVVRY